MTEREPKEIADGLTLYAKCDVSTCGKQHGLCFDCQVLSRNITEAIQKERTAREDAEKLCDTYRVGYYQRIDRIASLEAALRESNTVSHACDILWDECVKNKAKQFGEWKCSVDGKAFTVRIELDKPKSAEAPESAPKEPEDLGEIMGQAAKRVHDTWKEIEKKPKPPAPGASEAPECAHVDTLGRGKCDRCGIWEEEYRLLIEPKAKDSSVQKALDENMKKHDGVMRELEDKELGELAAMPELEKMQCLLCMGKGKLAIPDGVNKVIERGPCNYCNGTGEVWVRRGK